MQAPLIKKQLVLVGGGHANVQVMTAFAQRPFADVAVILISDQIMAGYSGMLPGWIAGQYDKAQSHIDLARLCKACGITFIHDRFESIDTKNRLLKCTRFGDIYYDVLSINTGSLPHDNGLNRPANVLAIKPVEDFIANFESQLEQCGEGAKISIVGGGVAAVEVTFSLMQRYKTRTDLEYQLCHKGAQLLTTLTPLARRRLASELQSKGVSIHNNFTIVKTNDAWLEAENGKRIESDLTVLCTGGVPPQWLKDCDLETTASGFIKVDSQLQSTSHPGIFAAGDVAELASKKLERAGVYAVRQGEVLAKNCLRALREGELKTYHPQKRFLKLISIEHQSALAAKGWFTLTGSWVSRLKRYIDEKFVTRFNDFRAMQNQAIESALPIDEEMRCNGCAAKIEKGTLEQSLRAFGAGSQQNFTDDAATITVPEDKVLIQSIDFFRALIDNPYINAQVTLNHALNDCYAMGGIPDSIQTILGVVPASGRIQSNTLAQTNLGIKSALTESGARVIGGHTAETNDPILGFTINSFLNPAEIWRKTGAKSGDVLILTKSLGTGVIFAAHGQALANGEDVEACIESMLRSNHIATQVLRRFAINACTDISGFGLFGHLCEMLPEAGVSIEIRVSDLPPLPGVLKLLSDGIRSSLHASNRSKLAQLRNLESFNDNTGAELLFDPQTSGGLLCSLPREESSAAIEALQKCGYSPAIIGSVYVAESPALAPSVIKLI